MVNKNSNHNVEVTWLAWKYFLIIYMSLLYSYWWSWDCFKETFSILNKNITIVVFFDMYKKSQNGQMSILGLVRSTEGWISICFI